VLSGEIELGGVVPYAGATGDIRVELGGDENSLNLGGLPRVSMLSLLLLLSLFFLPFRFSFTIET